MKELLDNQNFLHNYFSLCLDNKKKRNDHLYLVADVSEGVHDKKYARQFYYKKKKKRQLPKVEETSFICQTGQYKSYNRDLMCSVMDNMKFNGHCCA